MRPKKNILLTFDYEPYLGARSGTAHKCILAPTEALLVLLKNHHAKGVFFIDTLYLQRLRSRDELRMDYEAILLQLSGMHKEGHYVFPHIHPHWMDAEYLPGIRQFSLNNLSRYSAESVPSGDLTNMFRESFAMLNNAGINYTDWGYRAGGWCIQPFNHFRQPFIENNIRYDFSVLPGFKNESPSQAFDFSDVKLSEPYFFSGSASTPDPSGQFTEFPISALKIGLASSLADRVLRKYLWRTDDRGWGDGQSAATASLKYNISNSEMISVDLLNLAKLPVYKEYVGNFQYMHWISHPKMLTRHGLKMFGDFLTYAANNFDLNFDFKTMVPLR